MVRYLSDDWLAEADAALAGLPALPRPVVVGFVVTDGPDGDRSYRLVLGPDRVGVAAGTEGAGVVLTQRWDTARAIARGEHSAQRAFLDGDVRLGGDVRVLLGHQGELAAIDDRLAELRARTTF